MTSSINNGRRLSVFTEHRRQNPQDEYADRAHQAHKSGWQSNRPKDLRIAYACGSVASTTFDSHDVTLVLVVACHKPIAMLTARNVLPIGCKLTGLQFAATTVTASEPSQPSLRRKWPAELCQSAKRVLTTSPWQQKCLASVYGYEQ